MNIEDFIIQQGLILVPALYVLGMILKGWKLIPDNIIPTVLLFFGITGAMSIMGIDDSSTTEQIIQAVLQGILVTGAAVYTNQLVKQHRKKKDSFKQCRFVSFYGKKY